MTTDRMKIWEGLLRHAFDILDSAEQAGGSVAAEWSLGGGTMLMRRYQHRVSKDIDIFLPDPQALGFLSPRLNSIAEAKTSEYVEQSGVVKLYFETGEIDFIACLPLTAEPVVSETILDRPVRIETDAEIISKKVEYRGAQFKARDIFDLACVIERNRSGLATASDIFRRGRAKVEDRLRVHAENLREDFAAIDTLDFNPSFEECVTSVRDFLATV